MILDVAVPRVVVPLNPGKNITVISEVVAMMHLLRYSGRGRRRRVQRPAHQADEGAARGPGVSPGRL